MDRTPSGQCLNSLALAFAGIITKGLTPSELNILGLFLSVLADNVSLIAAVNQVKCDKLQKLSSGNSSSDSASSTDNGSADQLTDSIYTEDVIKPPAIPHKPFAT